MLLFLETRNTTSNFGTLQFEAELPELRRLVLKAPVRFNPDAAVDAAQYETVSTRPNLIESLRVYQCNCRRLPNSSVRSGLPTHPHLRILVPSVMLHLAVLLCISLPVALPVSQALPISSVPLTTRRHANPISDVFMPCTHNATTADLSIPYKRASRDVTRAYSLSTSM